MRKITIYYWDLDKNDNKIDKSFKHQVYDCPHCQSDLEFMEKDIGRGLVSCSTCDYGYWVNPKEEIEEL